MRKTTKILAMLFIILLNIHNDILQGRGQIYAFNGLSGNNLSSGNPGTAEKRVSSEGDKELEDTIREINRYTLSDSLWKMWRAIEDSQFTITRVDSLNWLKNFVKGVKLAKEGFNLINGLKSQELDSLTIKKIKYKTILLFEKARSQFEETFKLNPYDIKTQNYLIWIFQNLAELYDNCNNKPRAINMLECLTYILHDDPKIYYTLGEKYFHIGRWDKALTCLRISIDLILDDDWNKIDTQQLFWHYYLKANTEVQLNMTQEALLSLNYAKLIAPSETDAQEVQKKIDWINWDDGNLTASRKADTLNYRLNRGKGDYSTIKQEYLNLLTQIKTIRAKQDVNWRIAQLEFNFLNEQEKAVMRMLPIVKQVTLDSTKKAKAPEDQKYLEEFSSMCYILGMAELRLNHQQRAFIYFFQCSEFWWTQVGKSYLQLAKLSFLDNHATLKFAQQALEYENQLTPEERTSLYYLIFQAYKKLGLFEEAEKWLQKTNHFTMGD